MLDAIQQHHGDSVVSYFHQRALQQQQDAREGGKIMNMREEDVPEVSENSFRYPGPEAADEGDRPAQHRRRGRGGVALAGKADGRSGSRTWSTRSSSTRSPTGQLDECNLTMNEIRTAAEAMAVTLKNMMHTRISYAKKEKSSASTVVKPTKRSSGAGPSASAAA